MNSRHIDEIVIRTFGDETKGDDETIGDETIEEEREEQEQELNLSRSQEQELIILDQDLSKRDKNRTIQEQKLVSNNEKPIITTTSERDLGTDTYPSCLFRMSKYGVEEIDFKIKSIRLAGKFKEKNLNCIFYNYTFPYLYSFNAGKAKILNITDHKPCWLIHDIPYVEYQMSLYIGRGKFVMACGKDLYQFSLESKTMVRIGKFSIKTTGHTLLVDEYENIFLIGGIGSYGKGDFGPQARIERFSLLTKQPEVYFMDEEFGAIEKLGSCCLNPWNKMIYMFATLKGSGELIFFKLNPYDNTKKLLSPPIWNHYSFTGLYFIDSFKLVQTTANCRAFQMYNFISNEWTIEVFDYDYKSPTLILNSLVSSSKWFSFIKS